ncbi:2-oxoglutarate (2OG) and Fe(II)-dependent oxygenase superfamily protein [Quillaja saponaria]|uniref:2-oxoglutarate (2OG) and Fe(II)-dependent oxygenase superfamily protein n=1 Tax=Quillaja saponaria TaxID=32244 RepID=A0AAD7L2F6_QUISA|nr:2-oxoglutarate (2OG) and Fe(II)-dependent oxygenase superfamily protein [Quillaja saponaria]
MDVPYVQEIVRRDPLQVPQRYVRSQEEMENVKDMSHLSSEIPVIDLSKLSSGSMEELKKLDIACKDWGFLQLVNHAVPKEVLQQMKVAAAEFFELPLEEKNKYSMTSNDSQGYGHGFVVPKEQKLDWSDAITLVVFPKEYRKLDYWPDTPRGFRDIIDSYSRHVKSVAEELLRSLSIIMGMQKDALLGKQKESAQAFRLNYYPPCNMPDQVLGLSPHSDTSTITLLMQEGNVHGLEIRHKGDWVPVKLQML